MKKIDHYWYFNQSSKPFNMVLDELNKYRRKSEILTRENLGFLENDIIHPKKDNAERRVFGVLLHEMGYSRTERGGKITHRGTYEKYAIEHIDINCNQGLILIKKYCGHATRPQLLIKTRIFSNDNIRKIAEIIKDWDNCARSSYDNTTYIKEVK